MKRKPSNVKRSIALLLVLCLALGTLLTGCQKPTTEVTPTDSPTVNTDPEGVELIEESVVTPLGNTYGFAGTNGKYYTDYQTLEEEQQAAKDLAIEAASEGFVMLKNENSALPLKEGAYVSLFGMHSVSLIASTNGSAGGKTGANGIAESTLQMAMENAGFAVNPKLVDLYTKHRTLGTTTNELPINYYSNALISTYNGYHDAAVVVFSRVGSEAADKQVSDVADHSNASDHEMMLDDNEKALIKHLKEYYTDTPIIVLINSSNILQIPELNEEKATSEYGVDAIFWVGNTGNNAIEAMGKILSGEVNPSGHTVEVWEKDVTKGPTWTNFGKQTQNGLDAFLYDADGVTTYASIEYREGIYLGYKYYETAADDMNGASAGSGDTWYAENVLYPFGYGLSYTAFDWAFAGISANKTIGDAHQTVTMKVKVTNTGNAAGKDVVQVYANPPYTSGGIEKTTANLMGFAKTGLLKPGESQVVTIQFVAQDMASFDWNDANGNGFIGYELEKGDYVISARRNSHDIVLSETYNIASDIQCTTDYTTGSEITALFVDEFTSVNDSLLNNMISRANGLTQPAPASVADRTIAAEYRQLIDDQYTYRSYMDQGDEAWYVQETGIPSGWNQAAARSEGDVADVSILEMTGVDFSLDIEDGQVVQGTDEGSDKWEQFMNQLTWEEMAGLVRNGGGVQEISAVGVDKIGATETPLQLSGGTLWACPPILAASFNVDLAEEVGVMMGNEALFKGISYWQGNAMNIHRSPLSGRNVEYYSEDGTHNGIFAAAVARGVTSKGVTCHIKHMLLNDQESYRDLNGGIFTWATEQAIREIYAKPFEYALKDGNSTGVMGSFNRIGNINAQLNPAIKTMVNREWGNRAIFETDAWQGTYCPLDLMVRQGNQQILGTGSSIPVVDLEVGTWNVADKCVEVSNGGEGTFLSQTHYASVRKAAQEILWNYSNSNAIKNGYASIEPCVLEFDQNTIQSRPIDFAGIDFLNIEIAEGSALPEGFTMDEAGVVSGTSATLSEYSFNVKLTGVDGYITIDSAPVIVKVVETVHVTGETNVKSGSNVSITIDAPHYAYGSTAANFVIPEGLGKDTVSIQPGDNTMVAGMFGGDSFDGSGYAGRWNILNWYWADESDAFSSGPAARGRLSYADAMATDTRYLEVSQIEAGEYYRAFEYGFSTSAEDTAKLAEYGLSAEKIYENYQGTNGAYDVNNALQITGTATKVGTVEIVVTFYCPLIRAFSNGMFPNSQRQATPLCLALNRIVTINVG